MILKYQIKWTFVLLEKISYKVELKKAIHTLLKNLSFFTKAVRESLMIFGQINDMIRADFKEH